MSDLTALFFTCFHRTVGLAFLGVQIFIVTRCINKILLLQFFRGGILTERACRGSNRDLGFIAHAVEVLTIEDRPNCVDVLLKRRLAHDAHDSVTGNHDKFVELLILVSVYLIEPVVQRFASNSQGNSPTFHCGDKLTLRTGDKIFLSAVFGGIQIAIFALGAGML